MLDKIPAAEEFLIASEAYFNQDNAPQNLNAEMLKAFAKLHVTAALRAAADNAKIDTDPFDEDEGSWIFMEINKDSILNAYPLDNIK